MIPWRNGPLPRTVAAVALSVLCLASTGCQRADRGADADRAQAGSEAGGVQSEDPPATDGADLGGDRPSDASTSEDPPDGEAAPDDDASAPDDPADLRPCSAEEADAISEVIGFQLDAFVAQDFPAALSWATPGFRSSFTPQSFEEMITSSFPVPAAATDHRVLDCTAAGAMAVAAVSIDGAGATQEFQYGLQLLDEGWRIDGAVPLGEEQAPGEVI